MMTVFIDTNIVLDVFLENEGFWQDGLKIFRLAEQKKICACISAQAWRIFYLFPHPNHIYIYAFNSRVSRSKSLSESASACT